MFNIKNVLGREFNLEELYVNREDHQELLRFRSYLIYRIRNTVNGKSYIGDTSINLNWRFFSHFKNPHFGCYENGTNVHLYHSMRKYGLKNFTLSIVSTDENETEEFYISKFDSFHNGYNRSEHGLPFHKGSVITGRPIINKDGITKKILRSDLDFYLSEGWNTGYNPDSVAKAVRTNMENGTGIHSLASKRKSSATQLSNRTGVFSKESHDKAVRTWQDKGIGIYSEIATENRNKSNNLRLKSNCELVLKYLQDNNLEITEDNYNSNRDKIGKYIKHVPNFSKYNKNYV